MTEQSGVLRHFGLSTYRQTVQRCLGRVVEMVGGIEIILWRRSVESFVPLGRTLKALISSDDDVYMLRKWCRVRRHTWSEATQTSKNPLNSRDFAYGRVILPTAELREVWGSWENYRITLKYLSKALKYSWNGLKYPWISLNHSKVSVKWSKVSVKIIESL